MCAKERTEEVWEGIMKRARQPESEQRVREQGKGRRKERESRRDERHNRTRGTAGGEGQEKIENYKIVRQEENWKVRKEKYKLGERERHRE